MGALRLVGRYPMLISLRLAGQVVAAEDLEPPAASTLARKELDLARKLIDMLDAGVDVVESPADADPSESESAEIVDLMQVLKERMRDQRAASKVESETGSPGKGGKPRAANRPRNIGNLQKRSKAELYARAQSLGIKGRSSMNKDELIGAIRDAG